MFPVSNDYEQVTVAGFHMLHRSVWNGIINSMEHFIKTGKQDDLKGKIEMFDELGLARVTYYCFACVIANMNLHFYETSCKASCERCPVIAWKGTKRIRYVNADITLTPNCCHKDYFSWSEFITPDNYANKRVLAQNLKEHPMRAVLECAKSIRDLPWHDSNKTIEDLYSTSRNWKQERRTDMPNWCENELTIKTKTPEELATILETIAGENPKTLIDFNKIIPYPHDYQVTDDFYWSFVKNHGHKPFGIEDSYNRHGYYWCIEHWSTKWNACESYIKKSDDKVITIGFSTAWSPPIPVIQKLQKVFPNARISLKFWEGGLAFKGAMNYHGNVTTSEYHGRRGG